uniref:RanBD1 domain-containing protein n=1 Tax=Ascaris lumbricoides TaxID=6252 RepID=A0A0M3IQ34_ASCLU
MIKIMAKTEWRKEVKEDWLSESGLSGIFFLKKSSKEERAPPEGIDDKAGEKVLPTASQQHGFNTTANDPSSHKEKCNDFTFFFEVDN